MPLLFDLNGNVFGNGVDNIAGDNTYEDTTVGQQTAWLCRLKYQCVVHLLCQMLDGVLHDNQCKDPGVVGMDES